GGFCIHAFRYLNHFLNPQVHVPVWQPMEKSEATAALVDSENQGAHIVEDGCRVPIDRGLAVDRVDRSARASVRGWNTVCGVKFGVRVTSTKLLRTAVSRLREAGAGTAKQRRATTGGKDGREDPATQNVSDQAILTAVEGRLVNHKQCINEPAIEKLRPVLLP